MNIACTKCKDLGEWKREIKEMTGTVEMMIFLRFSDESAAYVPDPNRTASMMGNSACWILDCVSAKL